MVGLFCKAVQLQLSGWNGKECELIAWRKRRDKRKRRPSFLFQQKKVWVPLVLLLNASKESAPWLPASPSPPPKYFKVPKWSNVISANTNIKREGGGGYLYSDPPTWTRKGSRPLWRTGRRIGRAASAGPDRAPCPPLVPPTCEGSLLLLDSGPPPAGTTLLLPMKRLCSSPRLMHTANSGDCLPCDLWPRLKCWENICLCLLMSGVTVQINKKAL